MEILQFKSKKEKGGMNLVPEKQTQSEELTPIEKEIIEQYIMKDAPENYADILEKQRTL